MNNNCYICTWIGNLQNNVLQTLRGVMINSFFAQFLQSASVLIIDRSNGTAKAVQYSSRRFENDGLEPMFCAPSSNTGQMWSPLTYGVLSKLTKLPPLQFKLIHPSCISLPTPLNHLFFPGRSDAHRRNEHLTCICCQLRFDCHRAN